MDTNMRRDFLKTAGLGAAIAAAPPAMHAAALNVSAEPKDATGAAGRLDVRAFGAQGDGKAIDTPAINRAIEAAAGAGGGTIHFPAGQYLCYSIHLQSNVALFLDQGAVIVAADPPPEGQAGGCDGTMLDATWKKFDPSDRVPHTGRIKFGTESNGGFKNVTVTSCVFDGCQGLALESVDGALLEDMTISNISMRDIASAPILLRLGSRLRGPAESTKTGTLQRITITNVVCSNADSRFGCIISGVPGHEVHDVTISNISIQHRGGGTREQAAAAPAENEAKYPEPNMFGDMPSQGFYLRHVKNVKLSEIEIAALAEDARPAFILQNVEGADLFHIKTPPNAPVLELHDCRDVQALWVRGLKDGPQS